MKQRFFTISVLVYAVLSWQFSCSDESGLSSPCGTPATVVKESGCGFNFQLDDGTRLYPVVEGCEDVFAAYRRADQMGRRVLIGFRSRPDIDISCTTALPVTVLCFEDPEARN
jgi:hypothetical protein